MNLRDACVKVCDSRSMHVWWTVMWWSRSMIYLLIVFLMSGGRGRAMVFSYHSIPLGACVQCVGFWWLLDFCNKYMSSLWLMLSPWIIRTLILPPLLASLIWRTFHRYHTPTIYLPQNSHHTYLSWHSHSHSEIYCHATFHRSVYYDTLHYCHIASMIM